MDNIQNLAKALCAAQAEITCPKKSSTVDTGKYSYNYTPLDKLIEHVRPILAKHGLWVIHTTEPVGDTDLTLNTILMHSSGESIAAAVNIRLYRDVVDDEGVTFTVPLTTQELGSQLSYMRRYSYMNIIGIATEGDDDDAVASDGITAKVTEKASPSKKASPGPKAAAKTPMNGKAKANGSSADTRKAAENWATKAQKELYDLRAVSDLSRWLEANGDKLAKLEASHADLHNALKAHMEAVESTLGAE